MGCCTVNLSMDAYLGYVLLSTVPVVLSNGLLDIDLNDPVNSDGDTGKTSFVSIGATGGLLRGEELRGSCVTLPVNKLIPGRLLVALPEVLGRGLARSKSDC